MSGATTERLPILPAQGVCNIISRGWNLFRLNMKASLTIILAPTVAFSAFLLLLSLSVSYAPQVAASDKLLAYGLIIALVALASLAMFFFIYGFACCTLIRFFYSALVRREPQPLAQCWRFTWGLRWELAWCFFAAVLMQFVFTVTDLVILFVGGSLSTLALAALGGFAALARNPLVLVVTVVGFIIFGFILLAFLIAIFAGQGFMILFPLLAVMTSDTGRPTLRLLKEGLRQVSRNFPRMIRFGLALFIFSSAVSMALHMPVYSWVWYEKARLGLGASATPPMYVRLVLTLWSSLASILLTPFALSAITLFWYDCQVRSDGLDLKLWLADMTQRQNKGTDNDALAGTSG